MSILAASLGSTACMAALFVTVALAAGPRTGKPGHGHAPPAGVCFLHRLVP